MVNQINYDSAKEWTKTKKISLNEICMKNTVMFTSKQISMSILLFTFTRMLKYCG